MAKRFNRFFGFFFKKYFECPAMTAFLVTSDYGHIVAEVHNGGNVYFFSREVDKKNYIAHFGYQHNLVLHPCEKFTQLYPDVDLLSLLEPFCSDFEILFTCFQ